MTWPSPLVVNLGGEGEIPGVINQQGPWALDPSWRCSRDGRTLAELQADGHAFIFCDNDQLSFPTDSVDVVFTNSVPIDISTHLGPGVQTKEILRILKPGGKWIKDGVLHLVKP